MYGTQNFKKGGITDGKISPCSDIFEKRASIKFSEKKSKPKVVHVDKDKKQYKFELRISHEYEKAPMMKKRGSKSLVTRTHSQLS